MRNKERRERGRRGEKEIGNIGKEEGRRGGGKEGEKD